MGVTAKPHDAFFKAAFEHPDHAAALFRCTLAEELRESIDFSSFAHESGSFVDPKLADSHSDLLFSARLRGGEPVLLYLLLEHQSTNDRLMPLRLLEYLTRICRRHLSESSLPLPLIIPLVVSHAPEGWTAATSFHQLFAPDPASIPGVAELIPSFRISVDDLAHLSNEQIRARALSAFHKLALWVLRDARDIDTLLRNAVIWADAAAEALRTPNGMEAVALVLQYISVISDRVNFRQFRDNILMQSTETEKETVTMSAAEEWMLEARVEALRDQLKIKFGAVPREYQKRLAAATEEQVKRYTARILSAETIEDVFTADVMDRSEKKRDTMSAAEEWMLEARVEALTTTLRRQLEIKFGAVGREHQARLEHADEEQLNRYVVRILSAPTIEDVFADPS